MPGSGTPHPDRTSGMSTPLRIEAVEHLEGARIRVAFSNGRSGVVDLQSLLTGPLLAPLNQPGCFEAFELNAELGTITWPNGADLAPEAIYFQAFQSDPSLQETFQAWGYLATPISGGGSQR